MAACHHLQRALPRMPALGLSALFTALALPAGAQVFVSSDRTVAGGNPLNGTYYGQSVLVGASGAANGIITRVANITADVVDPALFSYSDQTGGGLGAYSNSVVRIAGATFTQHSPTGFGGYANALDTAHVFVNGGNLRGLSTAGAAPGAAGAQITVNGGVTQNGIGGVAYIVNGALTVNGGTLRAQGGNAAIAMGQGSVVNINGGLVESAAGSAVYLGSDSALTMNGGTVTGSAGGGPRWGVRVESVTNTARLQGGTVNGGLRADAVNSVTNTQAALGGGVAVNGGVFAYGNAAIDVTGGSYTRFSGADASFFAMGVNTVNFFGTDLALSAPTAGTVFESNTFVGNFYTFTSGTFSDGQSAVGLRLFDAVSIAGNALPGGFTLNPSPVPEPSSALLLLLSLPALGAIMRRRWASA